MALHVDDAAFVRAPVEPVYRRLTDVGAWGSWWPGVRTLPLPDGGGAQLYAWELRRGPARAPLRVTTHPHAWRHNAGFGMTLEGDLRGRVEWWLEPGWGGTVVHHLLSAEPRRGRPETVLRSYRRVLRRGLWAFKDQLQADARERVGLAP